MAGAVLSPSFALPVNFRRLSLNGPTCSLSPSSSSSSSSSSSGPRLALSTSPNSQSFSFSRGGGFNLGSLSISRVQQKSTRRQTIVCEATTQKRTDSAVKRHKQSEKRRLYNKSRKSEVRTRMKKVLVALDKLRRNKQAQPEDVIPIEALIAEAYKAIDKAVQVGTLHRNTGAHRKSRLARRKRAVSIHHGWYNPAAAVSAA